MGKCIIPFIANMQVRLFTPLCTVFLHPKLDLTSPVTVTSVSYSVRIAVLVQCCLLVLQSQVVLLVLWLIVHFGEHLCLP
jgi:hypothetical protein